MSRGYVILNSMLSYDDMEEVAWRWQNVDGAMAEAPLTRESVGANPTDRGKNGTKPVLLVDACGAPPSLVVTGANRHDVTQLEAVLDALCIRRAAGGLGRGRGVRERK